jgi:hypothetical protein
VIDLLTRLVFALLANIALSKMSSSKFQPSALAQVNIYVDLSLINYALQSPVSIIIYFFSLLSRTN